MDTSPLTREKSPLVGLALGGGGLRGAAHIGVLKVLQGAGIVPAFLAGTSAGSVIAGLYAAGYSPDKIASLLAGVTPGDLWDPALGRGFLLLLGLTGFLPLEATFSPRWIPHLPLGLLKGEKLEKLLLEFTRHLYFHQLQLPLAVVATDLNTGTEVIFCSPATKEKLAPRLPGRVFITNQPLGVALRASTAIPGIFYPKKVGRRLLVDGGLKNNVPAGIVKAGGARVVLAVDLEFASQRDDRIGNFLEVMLQTSDIMGQTITDLQLAGAAHYVLYPQIYDMNLLALDKIPAAIERGAQVTAAALPKIKELIRQAQLLP